MSDEKTSDMNENIVKRVRVYIVFFAILILLQIWGGIIWSLISSTMAVNPDESAWAQKIIESFVTVLGLGAFLIVNFARDINLHDFIDKSFLHVRRKTGEIIQQEMIREAQKVNVACSEKMKGKKSEILDLFYHFVNKQVVLRPLAFTYWEQYFVNISIIFFGTISFLISSAILLLRWKIDVTAVVPLIFVLIILLISLSTQNSLIPKIYELPVKQIDEIYNSQTDEFKKEVESRFGEKILIAGG